MKKADNVGRVKRLFNGDYVLVHGVSPALIDRVQAGIKEPKAPVQLMDTGEELINYNDPEYQEALRAVEAQRNVAALNAIILFGLQLVDADGTPIDAPEDKRWERNLKKMGINWREEMLKMRQVEEFEDEEDELDARNDAYMLLIAFSGHAADLELIQTISGADAAQQAVAEAQFQG